MRANLLRATDLVPVATAGLLSLAALGLGWRGADWPAQRLRLEVVEQDGPGVWNNLWFAGHHTPGYGILFPILGAAFGAAAVAVASCVVAAGAFHAMARGHDPGRGDARDSGLPGRRALAASVLFAAGTVVNVAVGRLTFALGLAVGLAALVALRRGRHALAAVLVVVTAPASPVAAVMLALAITAWVMQSRRRRLLGFAGLAVLPVAAAAVLFPQGGRFPFHAGALVWSLAMAAVVALATEARVVRIAAALYAVACLAAFVVPNPLGANATRLGMFVAGPVLVLTARRWRPFVSAIVLAATIWWQWSPAIDGIAFAGRDPSSVAGYHQPLVAAVLADGGRPGRIEVVPTRRHWETLYVASELPLARGWERQLDMGRNAIFYEAELGPETYHQWLRENAVEFVALADVAVDPSGQREAEMIRHGLPFLEPVWHDEHWQLWRVVDAVPLVDGPARLVQLGPTAVVLEVTATGPVVVRVRYTSHWSLDRPGCVEATVDGFTLVRLERPGMVTLRPVLARSLPIVGALDGCPS